ncbi:MAG: hypothetical protein RL754_428 [Bacteroidota bacterium]
MRPLSRRKFRALQTLALFTQIRWWNIVLLVLGQYLAALFVFSNPLDRWNTFFDAGTHLTVWAAASILSFGFLINVFYDLEADSINRPKQTAFERLVRPRTSLRFALLFLFIGELIAFSLSWRASIFYFIYAGGLWFYSHKLRGIPILGHISAAVLALYPFFGIAVYHHYSSVHTILYGLLLGHTLFSREVLKDLMMYKGDTIVGKQTIASEFGIENAKRALLLNAILVWVPAFFTRQFFSPIVEWSLFGMLILLSTANIIALTQSDDLKIMRWSHLLYKVILVMGVMTIPFL